VFAENLHSDAVGQSCDIPAGACEARDEPIPNRIGKGIADDGDRPRGVLGCQGCRRRTRSDDVHLEPNQLACKAGQPV
jgi:hypothetical protein